MVSAIIITAPEIFLFSSSILLLLIGAFLGNKNSYLIANISIFTLIGAIYFVINQESGLAFNNAYITNYYIQFLKILILTGSIFTLIISKGVLYSSKDEKFEYSILILLSTLGMLVMVSANDLISLYMGIELQSLALYIIAAFNRDSIKSSESGLKYFVLGALSSGILLYGCSLIYGFSGSTNFDLISKSISDTYFALVFGLVFIISAMCFKIAAVPFHMWTPDVYEGAPTPVTGFFALAPKVAAIGLFARLLIEVFDPLIVNWQPIIIFVSVASMILGSVAAIGQNNIKRLMAYSSIGHVGFALVGLSAGTFEGIRGLLIYLTIYVVMNIGAFACILCMRRDNVLVEDINDLSGLAKRQPIFSLFFAIMMFSLAGIPPLGGFFAKLYVFMAAVDAELYFIAIIGVLSSVVGAFYYLRIVKIMYFDEITESFDKPVTKSLNIVIITSGILILLFFVYPSILIKSAGFAASALF
jgi:NADH-quinone oxidoreductase subunit N